MEVRIQGVYHADELSVYIANSLRRSASRKILYPSLKIFISDFSDLHVLYGFHMIFEIKSIASDCRRGDDPFSG